MRARGLTLVEILVGLLLLGLALGGGLALLRGASTKGGAESAALLAGEKARQAVEGLSKELSGMQAALLLHGDATSANLVATFPPGLPVLRQGYGPGEALVGTNDPPDLGSGVVLLAPTGEAFYAPTATLEPVSGTTYRVRFPQGCLNPLPFTEGLRLYRALPLELSFDGSALVFSALGVQEKLALKNFEFRYVYVNRAGREIAQTDYRDASYQEGGEDFYLSYLGLYAQAKSGSISRDAALRIPLSKGVTKVYTCGSQNPPPPGTGTVAIIINKEPAVDANVADVTLTAQGGYERHTDQSAIYTDVPAGPFTVTARTVTQGLFVWQPEGRETATYTGIAKTFIPTRITISYRLLKATLVVNLSEFPTGFTAPIRLRNHSLGTEEVLRLGPGVHSIDIYPGEYTLTYEEAKEGPVVLATTPSFERQTVASGTTWRVRPTYGVVSASTRLEITKSGDDGGTNLAPRVCIGLGDCTIP